MSLARLRVIYAALPPQGWLFLLGWSATIVVKFLALRVLPETPTSDLAYIARALVSLTLMVGVIVLFAARARATTPARFVARGGAFVAGPAVHVKAVPAFGLALWWGYAFDALPMTGLWLGVLGAALLAATAVTFAPRPAVALTPAGVEFRTWWKVRRAAWDDLTAVEFPLAVRVGPAEWWRIRESLLRVHPGYTADAIGYYGLHPEHRPAIGTEAERIRLHGELSHIWFRRFHGLGGRGPGQA
ncbi:PH domain-containing protein [Longispora sp. NPDC051575]|uniref:PH domain-containing protein n=1 Tax=Longispora sp. NPDC051575 TaxID=3154943 RepID=UPI00343698EE